MKFIISAFMISALAMMSFTVSNKIQFVDFFGMAYQKSFEGLEKLTDSKTGHWEFEKSIGDFNQCQIRFDLDKGVHAVDFIMYLQDEATAEQFAGRFAGQIQQVFPAEKYVRSERRTSAGNIIVYEYRSDDPAVKAKNPEVYLQSTTRDGLSQMIITLYEPLCRKK